MKKVTLKDFKFESKLEIHKGRSLFRLKDVLEKSSFIKIDYDVFLKTRSLNLQRDFVWSLSKRQQFILSILKGFEIAPISVMIRRDDGIGRRETYQIIDGKQRLSTVIDFVLNEFSIEYNGVDYHYSDFVKFDPEFRRLFMLKDWIADVVYDYEYSPISDAEKIAWFERINFLHEPQDVDHLKKIKLS